MDLTNYQLGENSELLSIKSITDHRFIAKQLVKQAKNELVLCSRNLDPTIYQNRDFRDTLQKVIIENKNRFQIKILIFHIDEFIRQGHFLLELAQRLSSFFTIYRAPNYYRQYNESLLIVDKTGYLHRKDVYRSDGHANFNDRLHSRVLLQMVEKFCHEGTLENNLKRLRI